MPLPPSKTSKTRPKISNTLHLHAVTVAYSPRYGDIVKTVIGENTEELVVWAQWHGTSDTVRLCSKSDKNDIIL